MPMAVFNLGRCETCLATLGRPRWRGDRCGNQAGSCVRTGVAGRAEFPPETAPGACSSAVGALFAPFPFTGVSGGLGGFDALQVERFLVSPQRVWLRDFRTVEAVKLAHLQAI